MGRKLPVATGSYRPIANGGQSQKPAKGGHRPQYALALALALVHTLLLYWPITLEKMG
jgi:hypothetical protein